MLNHEKNSKPRFFIGANTSDGFVGYADEILNGLGKVYIIKGGPGTGKSTFMKKAAEYAEEKGLSVERYFCSSDSDSLDAVVIREAGVGIMDGTAPHCADPKYPGAREEILNLGEFWNAARLAERFEEIKELTDRKSEKFATVYKYLGVCATLRTERSCRISDCVDWKKAEAAASRLVKKLGCGERFLPLSRQISSLGMKGSTFFPTYLEEAEECWYVSDTRGVGGFFFEELLTAAQKASLEVWISRDPLLEINALFFPEKKVAVLDRSAEGAAERAGKVINTERFVIRERIAKNRARLRFLTRLEAELYARVGELFEEIRRDHFALEEIYRGTMSFKKIDAFENSFLKKLFP